VFVIVIGTTRDRHRRDRGSDHIPPLLIRAAKTLGLRGFASTDT